MSSRRQYASAQPGSSTRDQAQSNKIWSPDHISDDQPDRSRRLRSDAPADPARNPPPTSREHTLAGRTAATTQASSRHPPHADRQPPSSSHPHPQYQRRPSTNAPTTLHVSGQAQPAAHPYPSHAHPPSSQSQQRTTTAQHTNAPTSTARASPEDLARRPRDVPPHASYPGPSGAAPTSSSRPSGGHPTPQVSHDSADPRVREAERELRREERRRAEREERYHRAEREARLAVEQEAKQRAEEDARHRARREARYIAEQEAKQRAEMEERSRAEKEARYRAEKEKHRQREAATRRKQAEDSAADSQKYQEERERAARQRYREQRAIREKSRPPDEKGQAEAQARDPHRQTNARSTSHHRAEHVKDEDSSDSSAKRWYSQSRAYRREPASVPTARADPVQHRSQTTQPTPQLTSQQPAPSSRQAVPPISRPAMTQPGATTRDRAPAHHPLNQVPLASSHQPTMPPAPTANADPVHHRIETTQLASYPPVHPHTLPSRHASRPSADTVLRAAAIQPVEAAPRPATAQPLSSTRDQAQDPPASGHAHAQPTASSSHQIPGAPAPVLLRSNAERPSRPTADHSENLTGEGSNYPSDREKSSRHHRPRGDRHRGDNQAANSGSDTDRTNRRERRKTLVNVDGRDAQLPLSALRNASAYDQNIPPAGNVASTGKVETFKAAHQYGNPQRGEELQKVVKPFGLHESSDARKPPIHPARERAENDRNGAATGRLPDYQKRVESDREDGRSVPARRVDAIVPETAQRVDSRQQGPLAAEVRIEERSRPKYHSRSSDGPQQLRQILEIPISQVESRPVDLGISERSRPVEIPPRVRTEPVDDRSRHTQDHSYGSRPRDEPRIHTGSYEVRPALIPQKSRAAIRDLESSGQVVAQPIPATSVPLNSAAPSPSVPLMVARVPSSAPSVKDAQPLPTSHVGPTMVAAVPIQASMPSKPSVEVNASRGSPSTAARGAGSIPGVKRVPVPTYSSGSMDVARQSVSTPVPTTSFSPASDPPKPPPTVLRQVDHPPVLMQHPSAPSASQPLAPTLPRPTYVTVDAPTHTLPDLFSAHRPPASSDMLAPGRETARPSDPRHTNFIETAPPVAVVQVSQAQHVATGTSRTQPPPHPAYPTGTFPINSRTLAPVSVDPTLANRHEQPTGTYKLPTLEPESSPTVGAPVDLGPVPSRGPAASMLAQTPSASQTHDRQFSTMAQPAVDLRTSSVREAAEYVITTKAVQDMPGDPHKLSPAFAPPLGMVGSVPPSYVGDILGTGQLGSQPPAGGKPQPVVRTISARPEAAGKTPDVARERVPTGIHAPIAPHPAEQGQHTANLNVLATLLEINHSSSSVSPPSVPGAAERRAVPMEAAMSQSALPPQPSHSPSGPSKVAPAPTVPPPQHLYDDPHTGQADYRLGRPISTWLPLRETSTATGLRHTEPEPIMRTPSQGVVAPEAGKMARMNAADFRATRMEASPSFGLDSRNAHMSSGPPELPRATVPPVADTAIIDVPRGQPPPMNAALLDAQRPGSRVSQEQQMPPRVAEGPSYSHSHQTKPSRAPNPFPDAPSPSHAHVSGPIVPPAIPMGRAEDVARPRLPSNRNAAEPAAPTAVRNLSQGPTGTLSRPDTGYHVRDDSAAIRSDAATFNTVSARSNSTIHPPAAEIYQRLQQNWVEPPTSTKPDQSSPGHLPQVARETNQPVTVSTTREPGSWSDGILDSSRVEPPRLRQQEDVVAKQTHRHVLDIVAEDPVLRLRDVLGQVPNPGMETRTNFTHHAPGYPLGMHDAPGVDAFVTAQRPKDVRSEDMDRKLPRARTKSSAAREHRDAPPDNTQVGYTPAAHDESREVEKRATRDRTISGVARQEQANALFQDIPINNRKTLYQSSPLRDARDVEVDELNKGHLRERKVSQMAKREPPNAVVLDASAAAYPTPASFQTVPLSLAPLANSYIPLVVGMAGGVHNVTQTGPTHAGPPPMQQAHMVPPFQVPHGTSMTSAPANLQKPGGQQVGTSDPAHLTGPINSKSAAPAGANATIHSSPTFPGLTDIRHHEGHPSAGRTQDRVSKNAVTQPLAASGTSRRETAVAASTPTHGTVDSAHRFPVVEEAPLSTPSTGHSGPSQSRRGDPPIAAESGRHGSEAMRSANSPQLGMAFGVPAPAAASERQPLKALYAAAPPLQPGPGQYSGTTVPFVQATSGMRTTSEPLQGMPTPSTAPAAATRTTVPSTERRPSGVIPHSRPADSPRQAQPSAVAPDTRHGTSSVTAIPQVVSHPSHYLPQPPAQTTTAGAASSSSPFEKASVAAHVPQGAQISSVQPTRSTPAPATPSRSPSRASMKATPPDIIPAPVSVEQVKPHPSQPHESRPLPSAAATAVVANAPPSSSLPSQPPPFIRSHSRLVSDPLHLRRPEVMAQPAATTPDLLESSQDGHGDEPSRRRTSIAPSIAPSITPSVASQMPPSRAPSVPPPGSSQVSLEQRKKGSMFSRFFRPSKSSKEPKPEDTLNRVTSHDSAARSRLARNRPTTPTEIKVASTLSKPAPSGSRTAGPVQPTTPPTASSRAAHQTAPTAVSPPSMSGSVPSGRSPAQAAHSPSYNVATTVPDRPSETLMPTTSPKAITKDANPSSGATMARPPAPSQQSSYSSPGNARAHLESPRRAEVSPSMPAPNAYKISSEAARRRTQDDRPAQSSRPPAQPASHSSTSVPTATSSQSERAPPPSQGPRSRSDSARREHSSSRRPVAATPARLRIPVNRGPSGEKKSPIRSVFATRMLAQKRDRTVSAASMEAMDGTSRNTLLASPSVSTISTAFAIPPHLAQRDVMVATQDWRNQGEDERRGRGGERRGRPPGVTFDVPEDPPEDELQAKLTRAASRRRVRRPSHDSSAERSS